MDTRALPLLTLILLQFSSNVTANNKNATPRNFSINREHVFVWFESPFQEGINNQKGILEKMIDLVGGTFGSILLNPVPPVPKLVLPDTLNDSVLHIPSLVAQYNQKNGNKTLKVLVSYSEPFSQNPSLHLGIEVAKFVADRANSIFAGTVDTLLLFHEPFQPIYNSPIEEGCNYPSWEYEKEVGAHLLKSLKSSRKLLKFGNNPYKLGLVCSSDSFPYAGRMPSNLFKAVDLIVPPFSLDDVNVNSLEERDLVRVIDNAESYIRSMKSNVETIPLVRCRVPTKRDFKEVSKFLKCWQLVTDWTEKNNWTLIMYEAFDLYRQDEGTRVEGAGWWRLKSETSLGTGQTGKEKLDSSPFIAKVDETYGINIKSGDIFSSEAAIYFDYRVRANAPNQHYTEKEVREMLTLVSSSFYSIVIGNKPEDDVLDEIPNVLPRLVAQQNQEERKKPPSFSPLTIISNIRYDKRNWGIRNLNWDRTWRAAKVANEIFPGTVRIIAFDRFGKGDVYKNWINFLIALKDNYGHITISTSSKFTPPTFTNIRIGTYLDLSDCSSFLKNEFPSVHKWISVLIVDISGSVSSEFQHHYVDYKLSSLFVEWRKCQQSLKSDYPNVEVSLSVSCSQLVGDRGIEQEAKCWEIVNDWSHANQVQIIFHQAFEIVNGTGERGPNLVGGWWMFKQSGQLTNARDSFVEKFEDLMLDSETTGSEDSADRTGIEIPEKTSSNNSGNVVHLKDDSHTGLVLFIVILVAGCSSAIIVTVYWYKRRMQQLPAGISEMELIQT